MTDHSIFIVLTRPKTIVSKVIHAFISDEYTHAAISFDKDLKNMYSFGRKYTYIPFIGRFKAENFDQGVYRKCEHIHGLVIEIKVTKEQHDKAKELINNFIDNSSVYRYHYMGLVYNFFRMQVSCEDRFICSEFVYHILKESGITDFKISRNLVRPQTLLVNMQNNVIYQGNLKQRTSEAQNALVI